MNQKGVEILFAQSPKYVPRQFGLCGTSSRATARTEPGEWLKQNVDCRGKASGKEYCIAIQSLTFSEVQTVEVFIFPWLMYSCELAVSLMKSSVSNDYSWSASGILKQIQYCSKFKLNFALLVVHVGVLNLSSINQN